MKKSTKLNFLKVGMFVSGMLTILIAMSNFILKQFVKWAFKFDVSGNKAASSGIIGGADGPTSIFLTSSHSFPDKYIWMLIFSGITGICFYFGENASRLSQKEGFK